MSRGCRSVWRLAVVLVVVAILTAGHSTGRRAHAYKPDDPKVKAILDKSIGYLESVDLFGSGEEIGGEALIALAIYKYHKRFTGQTDHPRVRQAIQTVKALARSNRQLEHTITDNYSLGIALIFLTELEPNAPEVEILLQELESRQQPGGGWGYPGSQTGDTSQTQYAVLGTWAAYNVGVPVNVTSVERVAYWLARTQDRDGGWAYQGRDPQNFNRINQGEEVSLSLSAAGLGSVYVCMDFLGFSKSREEEEDRVQQLQLPPALVPVFEDEERSERGKQKIVTTIDGSRLVRATTDGNGWFEENYEIVSETWQYYYMYGLERYKSFEEVVENNFQSEPEWYNEGVDFLSRRQAQNGSFTTSAAESAGPQVDTAFASLFLLRSTRETLQRLARNDGVLRGGYGLPADTSNVMLDGNQIVAPQITGAVDDLLKMLEDEDAENIEALLRNPDALSFEGLSGDGRAYTNRLRRIVRTGSWQARLVAVNSLGRQGNLDNVPTLIYALSDGDPRVVRAARDGLRLTSRRLEGVDLPDSPSKEEVERAMQDWVTWYTSVRPDAPIPELPESQLESN